jgi:glycosyltransferase involved in cell wall biosynthesis
VSDQINAEVRLNHPGPPPPVVSVIVAILNEENHIDELVRSLLAQDIDEPIELLLVDGMSTDKTRERLTDLIDQVSSSNRQVRLLDNPKVRSPYAFNIGIKEARGEFVAIFGAHASYEPNYLRVCVDVIRSSPDRVSCGGVIHTLANESFQSKLVVDVLSNSFGSSKSSFRTQGAGSVDNIPFPIVRLEEFRNLGGYDERLYRNEDNEMNNRLIKSGVDLRVTDQTSASYYPVSTARKLLNYGRRNGWWNAKIVALGLSGMQPRHFIPSGFTVGVLGGSTLAVLGRGPLRTLGIVGLGTGVGAHLALGTKATLAETTNTKGLSRFLVPPLMMAFHLSYGLGTLSYLTNKTEPGKK